MDVRKRASELSKELTLSLLNCGTVFDEYYRNFRELRLIADDLSLQSAILRVEHAFFMLVVSINTLKEQLSLMEVAFKKEEV